MSVRRLQCIQIEAYLESMGADRSTLGEVDPAWEDYEHQDWQTAEDILAWLRRAAS